MGTKTLGLALAKVLHQAILDAVRDAQRYDERGILPSLVLEATADLAADESILYQAVYTIFLALPDRLLAGSVLRVTTEDVDGGVRLSWSAKEEVVHAPADGGEGDLRAVLGRGPHGDLVDIALLALERFCRVRAGFVETRKERVLASSSFGFPAHVAREVTAFIPAKRTPAGGSGVPATHADPAGPVREEPREAGGVRVQGSHRPRRRRRRIVRLKTPTI